MQKYFKWGLVVMLWVVSAFLTFVFVNSGWPKFSNSSGWARAFTTWGYPTWFRVLVGVIEVLGGVLLLLPWTAMYAAMALAVIMLGAMSTHIAHGNPAGVSHEVFPLALLAGVIYLRWRGKKKRES